MSDFSLNERRLRYRCAALTGLLSNPETLKRTEAARLLLDPVPAGMDFVTRAACDFAESMLEHERFDERTEDA